MTIVLPPPLLLSSGVRVGLSDKDEDAIGLDWKRC